MVNKEVSIGIVAFMRPNKMKLSIIAAKNAGFDDITIAYNGPDELFDVHKSITNELNVKMIRCPFNSKLTYCRNRLIENIKTKYFMFISDDEEIDIHTPKAIDFLEKYDDVVVVGFPSWYSNKEDNPVWKASKIIRDGRVIKCTKITNPPTYTIDNDFAFSWGYDYIPITPTIFKSFVFDDVKFDENVGLKGEHEDFYFSLRQKHPEWKLAISHNIFAYHNQGGEYNDYMKYRYSQNSRNLDKQYMRRKWNYRKFIDLWIKLDVDKIYCPHINYKKMI